MMMDTQPSLWQWKRFAKLIALQFKLDKMYIGIRAIVLCIMTTVILYLVAPETSTDNATQAVKLTGFSLVAFLGFLFTFCFCAMYTVRAFREFKQRETGWIPVLLPASRLEKFTAKFLVFVVIVPLIYFLLFFIPLAIIIYLNDAISFNVFYDLADQAFGIPKASIQLVITEAKSVFVAYGVSALLSCFAGSCMFFMGSVLSPRHPLLISVVISIVWGIITKIVNIDSMNEVENNNIENVQDVLDTVMPGIYCEMTMNVVCIVVLIAISWFIYRKRAIV